MTRILGIDQALLKPELSTASQQPAGAYQPAAPAPVHYQPEIDPTVAAQIVQQALSRLPEKGELIIPENQQSLAVLLSVSDTLDDLVALDALYSMFPPSTRRSSNRVLLAIARSVTKNFGAEGRLPLTTVRSWGMLNAQLFTDEFAEQFSIISNFVLGWQNESKDFLYLDPSEIAFIEFMFESLHPVKQGALAAKVMDFRALGNRRMGLLRRLPNRIEQMFRTPEIIGGRDEAIQYAKDSLVLLDHIARPGGFAPIIEDAKTAGAKIVKTIQRETAAQISSGMPVVETAAPEPVPAAPSLVASSQPVQPTPPQPQQASSSTEVTVTPPKRLTKRHRTEASLRYLRGENPDQIGKSLGVNASAVEGWVESFVSGGSSALAYRDKSAPSDHVPADQAEVNELKSQVKHLTKMIESLVAETKLIPISLGAATEHGSKMGQVVVRKQ